MAAQRVGAYVEVASGVDIYYEDEGEGPALVLIPGWTFTTRVFDHQFAAFSDSYRVISFDPRSHGRSTVTSDGNNYATQAADLAAVLDHLKVENPVLAGWSAGSLDRVAPCPQSGHGRHSRARFHRHAAARDELRPERLGRRHDRRSRRGSFRGYRPRKGSAVSSPGTPTTS